jgi:type I restriction enzyme S subunit
MRHKLSEVTLKISDGSHNPPKKKSDGVPMLSAQNVFNNSLNLDKYRLISEDDYEKEYRRTPIQPGDILLTIVGTIGRSYVVKEHDGRFALQRSVALIKPDKDVLNSKYLCYFLQSRHALDYLNKNARGVAQKGVYLNLVRELTLPVPDITEQERIVSKIETLFTEVDKSQEEINASLDLCKSLVASYLQKAYYIDPQAEELTIKEFASVKGGKRLPAGESYSETPTDHPYIRVVDFGEMTVKNNDLKYISSETHSKISRYTISKEDLYISIAGTIGRVGTIKDELHAANLTENAAKITDIQGFHKDYLCMVLNSPVAQRQIKSLTVSTSQPKLALFRAEQIKVRRPSIEVQTKTVFDIREKISEAEHLKHELATVNKLLAAQKETILNKAFMGAFK